MQYRNFNRFSTTLVANSRLAVAHRNTAAAGLTIGVSLIVTCLLAQPAAFADAKDPNDGWQEVPNSAPLSRTETLVDALSERAPELTVPVNAIRPIGQQARSVDKPSGLRDRVLAMQTVTGEPVIALPEIREIENTSAPTIQDSELLSGAPGVNPTSVSNMDMFVGELKVLGKVDVNRVAIGNGGIIRAEVLKTGELLVIGQSEGSTSMRLWHKDETQSAYNIRVSENDPETRIRMERMVRLRVRMVEFRKSVQGELGIDWSDATTGPGFAAAGDALGNNLFRPATVGFEGLPNQVAPFSTYFGIASNVTSKINILAKNGDAVILAEPVLSAVNGGQASFLAGGEIPYPTLGSDGQTTVDFKEYGVRLQVAPRIDSGGNVRTFVETEISQLDSSVTINGTPGLLTRRAQTEVNVRSGETIVISGLLSSESSKDVDMIPGIGRLPIIGRLFRSDTKRNSVSELVIFVTPEVIDPYVETMSDSERNLQTQSSRLLEEARSTLPLME